MGVRQIIQGSKEARFCKDSKRRCSPLVIHDVVGTLRRDLPPLVDELLVLLIEHHLEFLVAAVPAHALVGEARTSLGGSVYAAEGFV